MQKLLCIFALAIACHGSGPNPSMNYVETRHAAVKQPISEEVTDDGHIISTGALMRKADAIAHPKIQSKEAEGDKSKASLVSYLVHQAINHDKDSHKKILKALEAKQLSAKEKWWPWDDKAKTKSKAEPQAVHQGDLGDVTGKTKSKGQPQAVHQGDLGDITEKFNPGSHGGGHDFGSSTSSHTVANLHHSTSSVSTHSTHSSIVLTAETYANSAITEMQHGYNFGTVSSTFDAQMDNLLHQASGIANHPTHAAPDTHAFPHGQDPYLSEWIAEAGVTAAEWSQIHPEDQLMIATELEQSKAFEETKAEYEGLSFPDMEPMESEAHGEGVSFDLNGGNQPIGHGHGAEGAAGSHDAGHGGSHHSLEQRNAAKWKALPQDLRVKNASHASLVESKRKAVAHLHDHGKIVPLVPVAVAATAAAAAVATTAGAISKEYNAPAINGSEPDVDCDRRYNAILAICEDTAGGAEVISTKHRDPVNISAIVCHEKFHELMMDVLASLDEHPSASKLHHYEALAGRACEEGEKEADTFIHGLPAEDTSSPEEIEEAFNIYCEAMSTFVMEHPIDACFPADASVLVRGVDGDHKTALRNLRAGDLVAVGDQLTGSISFKPVLTDLHSEEEHARGAVRYLMLRHNLGSLNLTGNHFVATQVRGLIPASEVVVGDELLVQSADDSSQLVASTVIAVTPVIKSGMYAPLTWDGVLLVDGVLASSYIVPPESWLSSRARERLVSFLGGWNGLHTLEHTLMLPIRVAHAFGLPAVLKRLVEWNLPGADKLHRMLSPHDLNSQVNGVGWGVPQYVDIMGEFTGGLLEMLV